MKRIIVTGGSGFIGTNLILKLLKKKYFVLNVDKISVQSNFKLKFLKEKNYKFHKIDLANLKITKIINIFKNFKPDAIINLASETHVDRSIYQSKYILFNNINLQLNIIKTINNFRKKIKFIHIGTDEIYGDLSIHSKIKFTENSNLNPLNPYSVSKASQINLIKAFDKIQKLNYVILNPSNNYGPYQFYEKFVPKSIILTKLKKPVQIYGSGSNIRNWIFVEDTVSAIISVLKKGKVGETYIASSSEKISNLKLVKKIFKLLNIKKNIKFVKDRPGHDRMYFSNNVKLKSIGWKPKIKLEDGLLKTINWYLEDSNLKNFKFDKKIIYKIGYKK